MGIFANIHKRKELQKKIEQVNEIVNLINGELQVFRNIYWYYDDVRLRKHLHEVSNNDVKEAGKKCLNYINKFVTYYTKLKEQYLNEPKIYVKFLSHLTNLEKTPETMSDNISDMIKHIRSIDLYGTAEELKKIESQLKIIQIKFMSLKLNTVVNEEKENPHTI